MNRQRRPLSLRAHLLAYGLATLIPMTLLAGLLLIRSASNERTQLEARLIQVADDIADNVDRELSNLITTLKTLATSPALQSGNLAAFHAQASAAVQGWGSIFLVEPDTLQQVLNTLRPWGAELPKTGDPVTVRRVVETLQPQVSDHFIGIVSRRSTFNIDIPIIKDGKVQHVMLLGLDPEHLLPILQGDNLSSEWVTTIRDRKGVLLARSHHHHRFAGKAHAEHAGDQAVADRNLMTGRSLEGEEVLRALVRSKVSGWIVGASIPLAVAEAPLRRTLWLWVAAAGVALLITLAVAYLFWRAMERPIRMASQAARALGRGEPVVPLNSSLAEANSVVAALQAAGEALGKHEAHQRMLLHELSHRVKNVLSVVQALIMRTLSEQRSMREAKEVLTDRIHALARAHELLMRTDWRGAPLKELIAAELAPFGARAKVEGPDVIVAGGMVQTYALVLHELATNAAKHGSLSNESGKVMITWSVEGVGKDARLKFRWQERDGPAVIEPDRRGFGSTLLEAVPSELEARPRLSYDPAGFVYELEMPLDTITVGSPST